MKKLGLLLLIAICSAGAGSATAGVPAKYRYAGVVGPLAWPATHYISTGDGLRFSFTDSNPPASGPGAA
jgi:hypothetical protein